MNNVQDYHRKYINYDSLHLKDIIVNKQPIIIHLSLYNSPLSTDGFNLINKHYSGHVSFGIKVKKLC